MRNESFRASCVAITLMSATFFAALLYLPQFLQKQLGFSPLEAGVGVLPFLATFAVVSFVAGPLYNRSGRSRWPRSAPPASRSPRSSSPRSPKARLRGARPRDVRARARDRPSTRPRPRPASPRRRISEQPRRRHPLHVPDCRRRDRPRPDDDRLLRPGIFCRGHPGGLQARRGPLPGRFPDRAVLRRRQAAGRRAVSDGSGPGIADVVFASTGAQDVFSRTATQHVVARAADQHVVAGAAV